MLENHDAQISSLVNTKVDKVTGKGLSTNDFTDAYKGQVDQNQTDIAALSAVIGPWMFDVTDEGHLIMYYEDGFNPNIFSVNNEGHLVLTFTTT